MQGALSSQAKLPFLNKKGISHEAEEDAKIKTQTGGLPLLQ
jgi:hypothetical protein